MSNPDIADMGRRWQRAWTSHLPNANNAVGDSFGALTDEIERLRALLAGEGNNATAAAVPFDPWRPISTAPKDGRDILWCTDRGDFMVKRFLFEVIRWPTYRECFEEGFWQPIPAPPVGSDAGEHAGLTQASDSLARPSSSPSPAVRDETISDLMHLAKSVDAWGDIHNMAFNYWFEAAKRLAKGLLAVRDVTLREALEWYGEQARLARLIHSEGDAGRHALAEDGGKRARAALSPDAPTRCLDCPRRRDALGLRHQAKRLADDAEKYLVTMHKDKCDPDSWYSIRVETAITAVRRALSHPSLPDGEGNQ